MSNNDYREIIDEEEVTRNTGNDTSDISTEEKKEVAATEGEEQQDEKEAEYEAITAAMVKDLREQTGAYCWKND